MPPPRHPHLTGPAPCNDLNGAAAGDVVQIATGKPIDESVSIQQSLTLRAAPGFHPLLAHSQGITGSAPSTGNAAIAIGIEGIALESGAIQVQPAQPGAVRGGLSASLRSCLTERRIGPCRERSSKSLCALPPSCGAGTPACADIGQHASQSHARRLTQQTCRGQDASTPLVRRRLAGDPP